MMIVSSSRSSAFSREVFRLKLTPRASVDVSLDLGALQAGLVETGDEAARRLAKAATTTSLSIAPNASGQTQWCRAHRCSL